jgi:hypothetical protein
MSTEYQIVDIPSSLTPPSFSSLVFFAPKPPTQPRNLPEPKKNSAEWPQAKDLKSLHDTYGTELENILRSARQDGDREWCKERLEHDEIESFDLREWEEMFNVMKRFGSHDDTILELEGILFCGHC